MPDRRKQSKKLSQDVKDRRRKKTQGLKTGQVRIEMILEDFFGMPMEKIRRAQSDEIQRQKREAEKKRKLHELKGAI